MKKENNVKKMRWNMKNPDSLKWYFLIGALIGAVLFVLIYGFSVLNVTNDAWLHCCRRRFSTLDCLA